VAVGLAVSAMVLNVSYAGCDVFWN